MKKALILMLALVFATAFLFVGCNGDDDNGNDNGNGNGNGLVANDVAEWQVFINDYEAFVDQYIDMMTRMAEDPTDPELIDELTEMMEEVTTWEARIPEIADSIEDEDEMEQFLDEIARVSEKMMEALMGGM